MRILITILLILSFGYTDGQQVINAHVRYRGVVSAAAQDLLLDSFPGAAAAYSLRRIDKDATLAIRVRKDTTGQPEQDIGFIGNHLDTVSLKSFLNARSGFVVTWYDQSGSGRNATQSVQANQPFIALSGVIYRRNSLPSVYFGASGQLFLQHTLSSNISQPGTVFLTAEYSTTGSQVALSSNNLSTRWQVFQSSLGNQISMFSGVTLFSGVLRNILAIQYALFNGASSVIGVNTFTSSPGDAGTQATSAFRIGADPSTTGLRGYVSELIIYNSNQSSNKNTIQSNINSYYGVY